MKRAVILLLLAAILLTGCAATEAQPQEPYSQYVGSIRFDVDPAARTITARGYVFTYSYIDNGDTRGVSVTYPNGAVVTKTTTYDSNGIGMGTTSWDNADPEFLSSVESTYVDCYALLMVVPEQPAKEVKGEFAPLILVGIGFAAIGVWMYARPDVHWYWSHGWMYKDAEPSDAALGAIGAMGIISIILGVIMFLIGIFA